MLFTYPDHPEEFAIIGRLLAGYGELEFEIASCLAEALPRTPDKDAAFRMLYRCRGEEQRIMLADALLRSHYAEHGLIGPFSEAIADAHHCRRIRNQYAHCHWVSWDNDLAFLDFESAAKGHGEMLFDKRRLTLETLQQQETYFDYVDHCLMNLHDEAQRWVGKTPTLPTARPKKIERPPLYTGAP